MIKATLGEEIFAGTYFHIFRVFQKIRENKAQNKIKSWKREN